MNILNKIKVLILTTILLNNVGLTYGLTDKSKISILTYEPGDELYTIFGHTALRIQDSTLRTDNIYNFGTFDFSSPFFYIKFFGGRLNYFLSIIDYRTFYHYSFLEQRTVCEQTLDLTKTERDYLYTKLEQIYSSDDRFYKYDFFYDNCATRIRDLIQSINTLSINYDTTKYCCKSFRELLKPYISKNYWIDIGINIALGKEADKTAKSSDFMFLPDYIFLIYNDSGLIRKTETLIDFSKESEGKGKFSILLLIFVIVLILILILLPKTRLLIFYIYNSLIALTGIFLLVLSLFSDNSAFRDNLNILWTLPALFVLLTKQKAREIVEKIYLIELIVILILRQDLYSGFSWTFIPWISIMMAMYLLDSKMIRQVKTFINS